MNRILSIATANWERPFTRVIQDDALHALEAGQVLFFPALAFPIAATEVRLLDPAILSKSKNVSYNPATQSVGGTRCDGAAAEAVKALMQRYADATQQLLQNLLPYGPALKRERTSLRPAQVEGRVASWRKDDTRLHVDSFPSNPVHGRRILRVFCNVNPTGQPRTWRIGEPFPNVAKRFWAKLPKASRLKRRLLSWLHITKGFRTDYDHYMLQLHDAMKADTTYQKSPSHQVFDFPAGSAWACFTDQVPHAALAGQHQLEQTFTLPVEALRTRATAPLLVLEQLAGRPLTSRPLAAPAPVPAPAPRRAA